jgi:hypothetical protein
MFSNGRPRRRKAIASQATSSPAAHAREIDDEQRFRVVSGEGLRLAGWLSGNVGAEGLGLQKASDAEPKLLRPRHFTEPHIGFPAGGL